MKRLFFLVASLILVFLGSVLGFGISKFDIAGSRVYEGFFEGVLLELQETASFSDDTFVRAGFNETAGRDEVGCDEPSAEEVTILILGQSNAANSGGEAGYEAAAGVLNLNILDGKCYRAVDPLLGATGLLGSVWSRLGDRLLDANGGVRVVLVPIAVGGTSVNRWSERGDLNERLRLALSKTREAGLAVSFVLWEQGASDARTAPIWSKRRSGKFVMYRGIDNAEPWYTMKKDEYKSHLESIRRTIRSAGTSAPFLVAISSMCANLGSPEVRNAQREFIAERPDVLAGPDYDSMHRRRPDFFADDCHLSTSGLNAMADAWSASLPAISRQKSVP